MLDLIFNKKCIICRKDIKNYQYPAWICKDCLKQIEFINEIFCDRCGSPFKGKCICFQLEDSIKEIKSCFLYNGIGKELIHKWKYSKIFFIKDYFERIFIKNYPYKHINFDIVFYIPIHFLKKIYRGFNQAEVLAKIISENFSMEMNNSLKRKKYRKAQFLCKDYIERSKNIQNVFKITKNRNFNNILLIDDIITSGATVNEVAKLFKFSNIYVYTLSTAR
jgi:ComF family protein